MFVGAACTGGGLVVVVFCGMGVAVGCGLAVAVGVIVAIWRGMTICGPVFAACPMPSLLIDLDGTTCPCICVPHALSNTTMSNPSA